MFSSREELCQWVFNKGIENGYVIVTGRSRSSNDKRLGITYVGLVCDRGGKYGGSPVADVKRKSGTKKKECPFKVEGKYNKPKGGGCCKLKIIHITIHLRNISKDILTLCDLRMKSSI